MKYKPTYQIKYTCAFHVPCASVCRGRGWCAVPLHVDVSFTPVSLLTFNTPEYPYNAINSNLFQLFMASGVTMRRPTDEPPQSSPELTRERYRTKTNCKNRTII